MKGEINTIVSPDARKLGLKPGDACQVVTVKKREKEDPTGTVYTQVQLADGRTVNLDMSADEATVIGVQLIAAGMLASGQLPPLILTRGGNVFKLQ